MTALRTTTNKNKYNAKTYATQNLRIKRDGSDGFTTEELKAAAEAAGESTNAFILQAIRERLQQLK